MAVRPWAGPGHRSSAVTAVGRFDEMARPAHAAGSGIGMIAELLRHPAGAAAEAQLLHGAVDCGGYHVGGRGV